MQKNDFYRAFEDRHRGSRELIKGRLSSYLPFINPLKDIYDERPILDLGCGRGEWLELTREAGFKAHGVDLDEGMLIACRERGLSVETQDAITALKQLPDHSLVIVSGFHIAEHLHFHVLQEIVQEALRVLKPAGLLILETPNPENIAVGTTNFYLDPTHQRPLPPLLLSFLTEHTGFSRTKIIRLQESPELVAASATDLLNVINGTSPDYAIVAQTGAASKLLEKFDASFEKKYGLTLDMLASRYDAGIQTRFSKIEDLIKKAESRARQAESHAQRTESHARQAESRAQQAESHARQAESRAQQAESHAQQAEFRAQQAESRARELHTTLRAIYTSRSWRLTYPLRQGMRLTKIVLRPALLNILGWTLRRADVKAVVLRILTPFPRIKARLRVMAMHYGLLQSPYLSQAGGNYQPIHDSPSDNTKISEKKDDIIYTPAMHQWFIDVSALVHRDARTGIQRVTRSILRELLSNSPEGIRIEPIYATPDRPGYFYARQFTARFLGRAENPLPDAPIIPQVGDVFLGLDLQHQVVLAQEAALESMRRCGVTMYFVVYDLLPVLLPHDFPSGTDSLHARWLEVVCSSDGALCIAASVADELHAWAMSHGPAHQRPFHIGWFHLGADIENSAPTSGIPTNAEEQLNALRQRPTFLMVGTLEPRKRHEQTLQAFDLLWREGEDVNLVIVGKAGWMVDALVKHLRASPEKNIRLFWFDGISDEYLEKIYSAVTCLIAASEGEGFGLPLIEAARHKLPIIARDIPVFREVAGDHAHYFSGMNAQSLADSIRDWLKRLMAGKAPDSEGIVWLTWEQSAARLVKIIRHDDWALQLASKSTMKAAGGKMRILVLCTYPIQSPRHGGQLRAYHLVKKYRELGHEVFVCGVLGSAGYPEENGFVEYPGEPVLARIAVKAHQMDEYAIGKLFANNNIYYETLAQKIKGAFDMIHVEQPWLFEFAFRIRNDGIPNARIIYGSQNIEHALKHELIKTHFGEESANTVTQCIQQTELFAIEKADAVICVSQQDMDWVKTHTRKPVVLAPNGVSAWHVTPAGRADAAKISKGQRYALYCASAHPPNMTGFFTMFGGGLGSLKPDEKLIIAGGAGLAIANDPRLHQSAKLADRVIAAGIVSQHCLEGLLEGAQCMVLPLTQGGGTNLKTAEALWSGKHMVATTVAMRGFERFIGEPGVKVCDTPSEFKRALREAMAAAPLQLTQQQIEARRSVLWAHCLQSIPELLNKLIEES